MLIENQPTVQTQVLEAAVGKVVLHDGHECGHLTEEQHLVVGDPELGQDTVQQLKLPRGAVQVRPEQREEEHEEHEWTTPPHGLEKPPQCGTYPETTPPE